MRYYCIAILITFNLAGHFDLDAQFSVMYSNTDISGNWSGSLYQQAGGYSNSFKFHLEIKQSANNAVGFSSVYNEGVAAKMSFVAQQQIDGAWLFTEQRIIENKKPIHLEWCYKTYKLQLKYTTSGNLILSGPWWGNSSVGKCIPGHIILKQSRPKA